MSLEKKVFFSSKKALNFENFGERSSYLEGSGDEFAGLSEYVSGDEVRSINWRVYAKTGKLYVNRRYKQQDINIGVVLLLDANLNFGLQKSKLEVAIEAMSFIAKIALTHKDSFFYELYDKAPISKDSSLKSPKIGSMLASVEKIKTLIPSTKRVDTSGLDRALLRIKKHSIIFVAGDFFYPFSFEHSSKIHEIVPLIIRDRFEEEPFAVGTEGFGSFFSAEYLYLYFGKKEASEYRRAFLEEERVREGRFRSEGLKAIKLYTDDDLRSSLVRQFWERGWR